MVGKNNSTILTVSYGTFSCTLEGFDDSFDMMKAIAEYFRDLAADDRYFGAEPPTPDADMLARIAEKEVDRKVEAVSRDGGVTLRPYQIEDAAEVEQIEAEPPVETARSNDTQGYVENEDYSENFFPAPETVGLAAVGGSVAARLQRIREAAALAVHEDSLEESFREFEDEPVTEEALVESVEPAEENLEESTEQDERFVAEDFDETIGIEESFDEAELEDAQSSDDHTNDIEHPTSEVDESVSPFADAEELEAEATLFEEDDFSKLLAESASDDDFEEPEAEAATDEEFAEMLKGIDLPIEDIEASIEQEETAAASQGEGSPFTARVVHVKGARAGDAEADAEEMLGEDLYDEEALSADTLNSIFDDEETQPESSLSDEDEADLMRELAEAEAEEADDGLLDEDALVEVADKENLFTDNPEEALASAQDLSALLTEAGSDDEVDRLMNEAENQLTSEDANRRRSTINHLKAAVASKRADSEAGNIDPDSIDASAYVEDLAEVVKPKRPMLRSPSTARERAAPAAPLKLVAEQKIVPDTFEPAEPRVRPTLVKPVRPRRIRATSAAAAEAAAILEPDMGEFTAPQENFVAFAERMDVNKLPELLEAAAAFAVFREGLEKFSRPQVMTRVREVMGDAFTREDGLRAFGQLLREGKIVKITGGRFTASDTIGFQPE